MICKKDVILWFKELESYKRIDTMCTLLTMCLPFELRFLGTCLEELGRRDSQELRGMELRVNNPQDLATDMIACQRGEPTDKKIRRKMALYLALIRACNRTYVTEIFRTLDGWGDRDFLVMNDCETLQELLLVYTLAANHPVFSFEQQSRCAEIFDKIKENKLVCDQLVPITPQQIMLEQQQQHHSNMTQNSQQVMSIHLPPPSHQELLEQQQNALHAIHLSGHHPQLLAQVPMHMLAQGGLNFSQAHLAKLTPADGSMQHPLTVESMPHMLPSNMTIPGDTNALLAHPNAAATWPLRHHFPPPQQQPGAMEQHPPQSSSPMLSQQSSPSSSRATSPNRAPNSVSMPQSSSQQQQQQSVRNLTQRMTSGSMKNMRRPSAETTPPPMGQQQQMGPHSQQIMTNDMILPQNLKHMDEMVMNNESSGNQMLRNGLPRSGPHARLKAGNYMSAHQQQPPNHSPVNQLYQAMPGNYAALPYSMQNMSIAMPDHTQHAIDIVGGGGIGVGCGMNSNKSAGSDSGSSNGSGEISPPETPTLLSNSTGHHRLNNDQHQQQQQQQQQQQKHHQQQMNYNKQLNLLRLNGRTDKLVPVVSAGSVSTGSSIIYPPAGVVTNVHQSLQQQPPQQTLFSTEMQLGPGGGGGGGNGAGGGGNLMQANNNNGGAGANGNAGNTNVNTSAPSQLTSNTVLISSPTAAAVSGGGAAGLIANSVILQQQQYNTNYPYHITTTARPPPLMTHQPNIAPPGTFRLPPAFSLPHNGEVIYSGYPPSAITFLSSGVPPPGTPPVTLRSNANAAAAVTVAANNSVAAAVAAGVVPPPQAPTQLQTTVPTAAPNAATTAMLTATAPPYSALTVGVAMVNKPVSCYNCGSQTHSGRDCQEASMDDVTRGGVYKLDYSGSSATANISPTTAGNSNSGTTSTGAGVGATLNEVSSHTHTKQHSNDVSNASSNSNSGSSSTSNAVNALSNSTAANVLNTK